MANKWFKHMNDALIGDTLQDVLASGRNADKSVVLFFYILETLSRQGSDGELLLSHTQTARRLHTSSTRIVQCLTTLSLLSDDLVVSNSTACGEQLEGYSRITVSNWSNLQTSGDKIKTKNKIKKEDKDTKRTASPRVSFDLESVYQKYPRKLGKQKGLEKLARDIKTEADFQALGQAVSRFVAHHEERKTDSQYIPHFSTFTSSWRDWCDAEVGTVTIPYEDPFAELRKKYGDLPK